jgi:hypothetical protein
VCAANKRGTTVSHWLGVFGALMEADGFAALDARAIARLDHQPINVDLIDLDPTPVLVPVAVLAQPQRIDAWLLGACAATPSMAYVLCRSRKASSTRYDLQRQTATGYRTFTSRRAGSLPVKSMPTTLPDLAMPKLVTHSRGMLSPPTGGRRCM